SIDDILTSIEVANLTGGPSANTFDVSGWTGGGTLSADGGSDSIVAIKSADFALSTAALSSTDGMSLTLLSIDNANLTGQGIAVGTWSGDSLTLSGTSVTLTSVTTTGNVTFTASGDVTVGTITTGAGQSVAISAGGAILDGNGAADNITTKNLYL